MLKELLPDFAGKDVLDLACGYGWHCKYAAEQEAGSLEEMLDLPGMRDELRRPMMLLVRAKK